MTDINVKTIKRKVTVKDKVVVIGGQAMDILEVIRCPWIIPWEDMTISASTLEKVAKLCVEKINEIPLGGNYCRADSIMRFCEYAAKHDTRCVFYTAGLTTTEYSGVEKVLHMNRYGQGVVDAFGRVYAVKDIYKQRLDGTYGEKTKKKKKGKKNKKAKK